MAQFVREGTAYCFEEALLQCNKVCCSSKIHQENFSQVLYKAQGLCVFGVCVCSMVAGIAMELLCISNAEEEGV